MILVGTAAQTRLDGVFYLTMDTRIQKGTKSVVITQSFALPQGTWDSTRPNGTVHTTHGYLGDDPMTMSASDFKVEVINHNGYDASCLMEGPIFGQSRATLNPDKLYPIAQRRYDRMMRDGLWNHVHKLADRTLSIRNIRQESLDQSGQAMCLSLGNYVGLFMHHLSPLAHNNIPEVVYCQLFIQGLTNALRTRVETGFRKHHGS